MNPRRPFSTKSFASSSSPSSLGREGRARPSPCSWSERSGRNSNVACLPMDSCASTATRADTICSSLSRASVVDFAFRAVAETAAHLVDRVIPLIPPPRSHQVRYHGVLAPCASGRDRVVPSMTDRRVGFVEASGRPSRPLGAEVESPLGRNSVSLGHHDRKSSSVEVAAETSRFAPDRDPAEWTGTTRPSLPRYEELALKRRIPWAEFLQRVFEVDALACPKCGGRMRVLSAITDPIVAARILRCLALPSRAPPLTTSLEGVGLSGCSAEPFSDANLEFDFDQTQPSDVYECGA